MSCSLLNNIKSACRYSPGGINAIWLLDINHFVSYHFRSDDLFPESYVEKIYISGDALSELDTVSESSFSETKSGDTYKQELKTFVSTLDAQTLSSLLLAHANKYVVLFRNSQGKYYTFGSDGGASLSFTQISGKEGAGYNITISKNSLYPLFESSEDPFAHYPFYLLDFNESFVCETADRLRPDPFVRGEEGYVYIWIADTGNGYGFQAYDFDTMRERPSETGFQGTYRTIGIGEHEWTAEDLKAKHRLRWNTDFRWHDWTDENIAALTYSYDPGRYEKPLTADRFLQLNGTWFTLVDGIKSYGEPSECVFKTREEGIVVDGWFLPDVADVYQLIGQAPRATGNVLRDVLNFVAASRRDAPEGYNSEWFSRQNISGLTLMPLGTRDSIGGTPEEQNLALRTRAFKRQTALRLREFNELFNFEVDKIAYHKEDWSYTQVRYCRRKSDGELKYKLVIDAGADKVLMLDSGAMTTLPELETGMERGVALRYMNRECRLVLKSWSEIQAEAEEIRSTIK